MEIKSIIFPYYLKIKKMKLFSSRAGNLKITNQKRKGKKKRKKERESQTWRREEDYRRPSLSLSLLVSLSINRSGSPLSQSLCLQSLTFGELFDTQNQNQNPISFFLFFSNDCFFLLRISLFSVVQTVSKLRKR